LLVIARMSGKIVPARLAAGHPVAGPRVNDAAGGEQDG
jgi:hypothetical protein